MRFLAFPFGVKIVAKPQVWCASKANTVDNPQLQSMRVLYDTLLFCFGEQRINKQRLVWKLVKNSQMNKKYASGHIDSECIKSNDDFKGSES